MRIFQRVIVTIVLFSQIGCTGWNREFYSQIAPISYPPTSDVVIFEYNYTNINDIYKYLFTDYLIVGKTGFTGVYESPKAAEKFAKSIGADILIASVGKGESHTGFSTTTTPTVITSYVNGYAGGTPFSGTVTTYGSQRQVTTHQVTHYGHDGLYLRNVNNVMPIWRKREADFKPLGASSFDGPWENESQNIKLYRSEKDVVAIFEGTKGNSRNWSSGDLIFIFNAENGNGIYLTKSKKPVPAHVEINSFGHLVVTILTYKESFSYIRK